MDTPEKLKRPWWKKKRWWAVLVLLWFVVSYPLSVGLLGYADGRGWVRRSLVEPYCVPLIPVIRVLPGDPVRSCLDWCCQLGQRHAASD